MSINRDKVSADEKTEPTTLRLSLDWSSLVADTVSPFLTNRRLRRRDKHDRLLDRDDFTSGNHLRSRKIPTVTRSKIRLVSFGRV